MDILLSNSSGKPIYQQIADQVKEQVCSGTLTAGEALPSMRLLAKELRISVITTKRAYEELEKDGFLYTIPAKGCYVAPRNPALQREEHLKKIEAHIDEILRLAAYTGLTEDEILEMVRFAMEGQK